MKAAREEAERTGASTRKIGDEAKRARPFFERLKKSTKELATNIKKSETEIRNITSALTKFAAAGTLVLTGTVIAAASFESGLTDVAKTTGLAGDELEALGEDLRVLSRELPITGAGLADIATVAGQLGINSSEDIIKFTETVASLATVSDFTAEAAAESLARLSNVFQLPIQQVDRLASVINELENNTTATAPRLTNFGQRLAVAANSVGITADEALGLSATLIDLGFRAEEAGTAVSKILIEMSSNAEKFAALTGQSVESFRAAMEEDAVGAFNQVAEAVSQLDTAEASEAFEELGLNGIRVRNVMVALSNRTDLLSKNIRIATDEFKENSSLQRELAVFLESTSNQFQILKNTLIDVAIEFGQRLLPAVRFVISAVRTLADAFLGLPSFVQTAIVIITTLGVAVTALAATFGLILLALPGVVSGITLVTTQLAAFRAATIAATASATGFGRALLLVRTGMLAMLGPLGLVVAALAALTAAVALGIIELNKLQTALEDSGTQAGAFAANVNSTSRAANEGARGLKELTAAANDSADATKESNSQLLKELGLRKEQFEAAVRLSEELVKQAQITADATVLGISVATEEDTQNLKNQENQLAKNKARLDSVNDSIEKVTKTFDVNTKSVKGNTASLKEQERQFDLLSAGTDNLFADLQSLNDIKFGGLLAELESATALRQQLLEAGDAPPEALIAAEIDSTNRIIALKTREVEERIALENRRVAAQAALIKKNLTDEKEAAEALQALTQASVSSQIKATADLISIRQKAVDDVKAQLGELVDSAATSRDEIEALIREAESELLQQQNSILPVAQQAQKAQSDVVRQQEAIRRSIRLGNFEEARRQTKELIDLEKEAAEVRKDAAGFVTEDVSVTQRRQAANTQTRIDLLRELGAAEQTQSTAEQANLQETLQEQEAQLDSLRDRLTGLGALSERINLQTNFKDVQTNLAALQTELSSLSGPTEPIKVDFDVSEDVVRFFEGDRTLSIPIEGLEALNTVGDAFVAKVNQAATQLEAIARFLASQQNFNQTSGVISRAGGGSVSGPGTGTSDSILARLSNGEFVMRRAAVDKFGTGFFHKLNALRLPGFADGGAVGVNPLAPTSRDEVSISLNLNKRTFDLRSDRDTAVNLVKAFKNFETGLVGG